MDIIANIVDTTKSYRIQETPYFKRLRLREESDLVHLREAKEIIEKAAENFLEPQIRQIRLKKLYEQIQRNIEKNGKGGHRRRYIPKSSPNLVRDRAVQAKLRGNEYSQRNRKSFSLSKYITMRKVFMNNQTKELQDNSFAKRKVYGQQVKEYNKQNIENHKNVTITDKDDTDFRPRIERNRKNEYGQYYTIRNRLNLKHSIKEFDDEYSDLLLQCLLFEKEHLDVCGFLEEQVRSSSSMRNKLMTKLTYSGPSSQMTINSHTSDSDIISMNSTSDTATNESRTVSELPSIERVSKSGTSQSSREIFDTCTKISKPDTENNKELSENDDCDAANEKGQLNNFIWKVGQAIQASSKDKSNEDSFDDMEITDSYVDGHEKVIGLHKFASAITKSSSSTNQFSKNKDDDDIELTKSSSTSEFYLQSTQDTETSDQNDDDDERNDEYEMAGTSTEEVVAKTLENENFDEMLQNIISHGGSAPNRKSLADELSNLFVAYGTRMIKEATNGNVDKNLIKAFAVKQHSSIRKAFKKLTTKEL